MSVRRLVFLLLLQFYCKAGLGIKKNNVGNNSEEIWNHSEEWAECKSFLQSPVALTLVESKYDPLFNIKFENFDNKYEFSVKNTGRTVRFNLSPSNKVSPSISGFTMANRIFLLEHFEFRWGNQSVHGSEHSINHLHYGAELQMAFFDSKLEDFENALTKPFGALILSIMIDFNPNVQRTNVGYKEVLLQIENAVNFTGRIAQNPSEIQFDDLFPTDRRSMFDYIGSYNYPPCNPNVRWLVLNVPVKLPYSAFNSFQLVQNTEGNLLGGNNRRRQPLRSREVWNNFNGEDKRSQLIFFIIYGSIMVAMFIWLVAKLVTGHRSNFANSTSSKLQPKSVTISQFKQRHRKSDWNFQSNRN